MKTVRVKLAGILPDPALPHSTPHSMSYANSTTSLRRQIAVLAARMMAEDGISDFGFAKRKAARQLRVPGNEVLPTNAEIETELRTWQTLYQDEEHEARLLEMRSHALEVMQLLADFRPYLTGAVLDGTAGRYTEIDIALYAESAKDVEIFFLNHNIPYQHREPRRPAPHAPEAILSFDWEDSPVRLSIYPAGAERSNRRSESRARAAQVEALLNAS